MKEPFIQFPSRQTLFEETLFRKIVVKTHVTNNELTVE